MTRGNDRHEYSFRSIDKDPDVLPPGYRGLSEPLNRQVQGVASDIRSEEFAADMEANWQERRAAYKAVR